MNVLIVEDEALACERLEKMLSEYDPKITVAQRIDTVKEAAHFMNEHKDSLDVVFMDIQLADGKSFEIFNKISYPNPIIFTTAFDEYALPAFKLNSIDYLLKPIQFEQLEAAIEKLKAIHKSHQQTRVIDNHLLDLILSKEKQVFKQRFLVKFGNRIQFKNVGEVACFYAEGKVCYLICKLTGKRFMIDHTLEELENGLVDPKHFFRVNRQYIIHIDVIKEVKSRVSSRFEIALTVPGAGRLTVSRNRGLAFKNWINS
ncbi:MAG: LytTR family DNA-binding domain-containing protein [Cyclobacteriaceae bacterium]